MACLDARKWPEMAGNWLRADGINYLNRGRPYRRATGAESRGGCPHIAWSVLYLTDSRSTGLIFAKRRLAARSFPSDLIRRCSFS